MQLDEAVFARDVLELRESDVLKAALERINKGLFDQWQRTDPADAAQREQAFFVAHGIKMLLQQLEVMAQPARQERADKLREQGVSTTLRRPTIASSTA